jgi:hypothetical protein
MNYLVQTSSLIPTRPATDPGRPTSARLSRFTYRRPHLLNRLATLHPPKPLIHARHANAMSTHELSSKP